MLFCRIAASATGLSWLEFEQTDLSASVTRNLGTCPPSPRACPVEYSQIHNQWLLNSPSYADVMVHTALLRLLLAITEYLPFQQCAARTSDGHIIQSYIVLVSEYTDWWPNTTLLPITQQTISVQNHAGDNNALLARTLSLQSVQYESWGTNVQWYVQDAVTMTVLTCKTLPLSQGTYPVPQSTRPYNPQCPKPQDLTPQNTKI